MKVLGSIHVECSSEDATKIFQSLQDRIASGKITSFAIAATGKDQHGKVIMSLGDDFSQAHTLAGLLGGLEFEIHNVIVTSEEIEQQLLNKTPEKKIEEAH